MSDRPYDQERDHSDADEKITDAWQRLIHEVALLTVDTAIVHASSAQWPLYALENYEEKLNGITAWAHQMRDEIHGFAEAHDGEETNDEV